MNMSAVLIPAALLYAFFIYRVFVRFKLMTIWRGDYQDVMKPVGNSLIGWVKRVLDTLLIFFTLILLAWPPVLVVMAVSQSMIPTWGIDIQVFAGFMIDLTSLPGIEASGLRNPELSGKTMIAIDTSSLYAWYVFALVSELSAIAVAYALVQMRALVMALASGVSFARENVVRIKKIGQVVIVWNLVNPFLQFFVWGSVLSEIVLSSPGIRLFPAFEINVLGLFAGLMLIVLSGVLREASEMNEEQELTI